MGIFDKVKNIFGKREEEAPRRLGRVQTDEPVEEERVPLYQVAKKWREDKQMQEPLVKRSSYKRKIQ
ncbi:MAG: hypothetical protein WC821_02150 [archaeon]|jgi:hypothetical protein